MTVSIGVIFLSLQPLFMWHSTRNDLAVHCDSLLICHLSSCSCITLLHVSTLGLVTMATRNLFTSFKHLYSLCQIVSQKSSWKQYRTSYMSLLGFKYCDCENLILWFWMVGSCGLLIIIYHQLCWQQQYI